MYRPALLAIAAVSALFVPAADTHLPAPPAVVAHMTSPMHAPGNTVPGIAKTAALGASWVEVDIRWTKAGSDFPVLMHDATLDRTTNCTGSIATLGLSQVTGCSAADYAPWIGSVHSGFLTTGAPRVPVPYGWDAFNAAKNANLSVLMDVKVVPSRAQADKLVHYLDRFLWRTRVVYMASVDSVKAMHAWYPDIPKLLIEYPAAGTMRTAAFLKGLGVVGYAVPAREVLEAGYVAYYHANGLQLWSWCSDTPVMDVPEIWGRLASLGVDAIITNQPQQVLEMISP